MFVNKNVSWGRRVGGWVGIDDRREVMEMLEDESK
jgi:hypothetical protein